MNTADILLEIDNLEVHFPIRSGLFGKEAGRIRAVDGVSLTIRKGEIVGLVGESGCGKSTTGYAALGMQAPTGGSVRFKGVDSRARDRRAAARDMQLIFQDPTAALNPRMTIADSIAEPLVIHGRIGRRARRERIDELMALVGLNPAMRDRHPGEISGGQRQRVIIARALALDPDLVVCDEAVSALDVSIQSQILNLLLALQKRLGLSYLFISHDLSVVRHIADRIAVMYLGRIIEEGPVDALFETPQHPYTRALLSAIPRLDSVHGRGGSDRIVLEGDLPDPSDPPTGCRFAPRCPIARPCCREAEPELEGDAHRAACYFPGEL